jgi:pyruvate,orthophosphate dikinase
MFFEADRIVAMREMILANDATGRRTALAKILPMQRQDFSDLFKIMAGLPVTIRLLDPPLHEFLPHGDAEMADVAAAAGVDPDVVRHRVLELHASATRKFVKCRHVLSLKPSLPFRRPAPSRWCRKL